MQLKSNFKNVCGYGPRLAVTSHTPAARTLPFQKKNFFFFFLKKNTAQFVVMDTRFPLQTDDATSLHEEEADAQRDGTRDGMSSMMETGSTFPPPSPLTPYQSLHLNHPAHPTSGVDLLHIIQYMEQMRQQDKARRLQADELCRRQEESSFTALLQLLVPASPQATSSPADATGSGAPATTFS